MKTASPVVRTAWALDHHVSVDLDLPAGPGRVAVIADTHSEPHPAALELVRATAPHAVLHAGDIGALTVLDTFAAVGRVVAVRGNIDGRRNDLPDAITLHVRRDGAELSRWLLVHVGVQGTRLLPSVRPCSTRAPSGRAGSTCRSCLG